MKRPTLRQQKAGRKYKDEVAKLSDEDCIKLLMPHTFWQHINFWLFLHVPILHNSFWKIVCWFYPYSIEIRSRHWRWERLE